MTEQQIEKLYQKLLIRIKRAGVIVKYGDLRKEQAHGLYMRSNKTITLSTRRTERCMGGPGSKMFQRLVTLAHEYGHHLFEMSLRRRRLHSLSHVDPEMVLVCETQAWLRGAHLLYRLGLRGRQEWRWFEQHEASTLIVSVVDVRSRWWAASELEVRAIRCHCGSRLRALGCRSNRTVYLACPKCGRHTRPKANNYSLIQHHIKGRRVVGLCRCRQNRKWWRDAAQGKIRDL